MEDGKTMIGFEAPMTLRITLEALAKRDGVKLSALIRRLLANAIGQELVSRGKR